MDGDGEQVRADSPIEATPGFEMSEETKEYLQKAKEAGWIERTAYDYAADERDRRDDNGWFGAAKIYSVEWQDDFGEVGPEIPELEQILFRSEHQQHQGEHLHALEIPVTVEGPSNERVRMVSPWCF